MNLSVLEPGELACAVCGQRVPNPREVEEFYSEEREFVMNGGNLHAVREQVTTEMSRCPLCFQTREVAQKIVDAHPEVMRPLGWEGHQLLLVESALIAIDALGIPGYLATGESFMDTDRQLRLALEYLSPVGGFARFSINFVPTLRPGFSNGPHAMGPAVCSAGRWDHMSAEQKAILHRAYGDLMLARTDGPMDVQPPEDGARGCLVCGIDHITVLRSKSYNVWGPRYEVEPSTVGGPPSPTPIAGYLCPEDRALVAQYGMGPTAMEHSLIGFLGIRLQVEPMMDWLVAWAGMPGARPTSTRWAHVDREMVRDQLERVSEGLPPLRIR